MAVWKVFWFCHLAGCSFSVLHLICKVQRQMHSATRIEISIIIIGDMQMQSIWRDETTISTATTENMWLEYTKKCYQLPYFDWWCTRTSAAAPCKRNGLFSNYVSTSTFQQIPNTREVYSWLKCVLVEPVTSSILACKHILNIVSIRTNKCKVFFNLNVSWNLPT